jgi:hypothetical protein
MLLDLWQLRIQPSEFYILYSLFFQRYSYLARVAAS